MTMTSSASTVTCAYNWVVTETTSSTAPPSVFAGPGLFPMVLGSLRYKNGWQFGLGADAGPNLNLDITLNVPDSGGGDGVFLFVHRFPIPPGAYGWPTTDIEDFIFRCIQQVEMHEAGEWFRVHNGQRPYLPPHGGGGSPYDIRRR